MTKPEPKWTEGRIEQLKTLWAKGLTAKQIKEAFGPAFTRNAIIGKVQRLGLELRGNPIGKRRAPAPKRPAKRRGGTNTFWTPERIAILKAGYSERTMLTVDAICAKLGCGDWRVYQGAKMLGLVHPLRGQRIDGRAGGMIRAAGRGDSDKIMATKLAARAPVTAPDSRRVRLADLDRGQCHFPTSPHMAGPGQHRFCGAEVERNPDGSSQTYCAFHHGIATRPLVSPEEREADNGVARMAAE